MAIDTSKTSSQPNRPNASPSGGKSQSVGNALARHQEAQDMASALLAENSQWLSDLGGAIVVQQQKQVERFADFVEKLQDKTIPMVLLQEELSRRAEKAEKASAVFTIEAESIEIRDFQVKPDFVQELTGKTFLKALEGI